MKTRSIGFGLAFGVALGVVPSALAQQAVQWRVEDGGNGHWYRIRPKVGDWFACRSAAQAAGGDLASISTAAEGQFIIPLLPIEQPPQLNRIFLGARQPVGSPPNAGWHWVDGSVWSYTNWYSNQPNGGEWFLAVKRTAGGTSWDDYPSCSGDIAAYLIEWSADCNGDGVVDYGQILNGTYEDSNSNGIPDCCEQGIECDCPADINQSGTIDAEDLAYVLFAWGMPGAKAGGADINGDAMVDANDLSLVLGSWGNCPN